MSDNDRLLFERIFLDRKTQVAPELPDSAYFEIFTAEEVLKAYDLAYTEIEGGLIGGGGDGGFDCMYFFVNDELLFEDTNLSEMRYIDFDVVIIQSKKTNGFAERALDNFILTSEIAFNFEADLSTTGFNPDLIAKIKLFRDSYYNNIVKIRKTRFVFFYATIGDVDEVHPNVKSKVSRLNSVISSLISSSSFEFNFIGARELLELTRNEAIKSFELKLKENPVSTGSEGYIALAGIRDYFNFIIDEKCKIKRGIFESNVRDFQGEVEVNRAIFDSLMCQGDIDFWWLNNGITVICNSASVSSKKIVIENPQIVNGLQTSNVIYKYFNENDIETDERSLLVRILVTSEEEARDHIIKATNSQTRIPESSLRATDPIHRDIEEYLCGKGFYYERKKNYYKNNSKPKSQIVSITYLAQSVLACLLARPDHARARPSSLLKKDEDYEKIFDNNYPLGLYYKCVVCLKNVEAFLRGHFARLNNKTINNLKFHVSMYLVRSLANKAVLNVDDILHIDIENVDVDFMEKCYDEVVGIYNELGGDDSVSKGPAFVQRVKFLLEI